VDFGVTVENTGERTSATNVIVGIFITKGGQYVTGIIQAPLNFGSIAPGASKTMTVTLSLNDAWLAAPAGTEIKIEAVVTNEDTRPDHTEGKRDIGTTINPGNCP